MLKGQLYTSRLHLVFEKSNRRRNAGEIYRKDDDGLVAMGDSTSSINKAESPQPELCEAVCQ